MTDQKCPLCGKTAEFRLADPHRRISRVTCARCGRYDLTMAAQLEMESPDLKQHDRAMLSGVTREHSEQDNPITFCSSDYEPNGERVGFGIAEILSTMIPRSTPDRIDRALLSLAHNRQLGARVRLDESKDWPLFFAADSEAMNLIVKHVVDSGLLNEVVHWDQGGGEYALTVEGWARVDELRARIPPESDAAMASNGMPATDAETRQRLLYEFYRIWQGPPRSPASTIHEAAERLGLPGEQCLRNAKLLREKGLLESRPTGQGCPDRWRITASGVEWVERREREPHQGTQRQPHRATHQQKTWDVFICHASEDKESFVHGLAEAMRDAGLKVWYDEFSLRWGDSLRRSIDRGLAASRYGIVVLSPAFFEKQWPQIELDGLVQREVNGESIILPIWHNVGRDDVAHYSLPLAGRKAVCSAQGINEIAEEAVRRMKGNEAAP